MAIDGGAHRDRPGRPAAVINGAPEERMRVGCGSATIGMFAKQWHGHVDEVVVVDDHITGVLSEHQAGKLLGMPPHRHQDEGPALDARAATSRLPSPASAGAAPISPIRWRSSPVRSEGGAAGPAPADGLDHRRACAYYELDDALTPVERICRCARQSVERIAENCEPALCTVLFMGGAGGSLRAGVTENPVRLTRSVKDALTRGTCGGAPVYVWPGGGITFMVDVTLLPENSFGYVPTPAIVAPIEFTLRLHDYAALGGHMDTCARSKTSGREQGKKQIGMPLRPGEDWPLHLRGRGRRERVTWTRHRRHFPGRMKRSGMRSGVQGQTLILWPKKTGAFAPGSRMPLRGSGNVGPEIAFECRRSLQQQRGRKLR